MRSALHPVPLPLPHLTVTTEGSKESEREERFDGATVKLLDSLVEFAEVNGRARVAPDEELVDVDGVVEVEPGRLTRRKGCGA